MSLLTVSAVGTATAELTATLEGVGASLGATFSASLWPIAAIAAATTAGKLFGTIWNKNRARIANVISTLQIAQKRIVDLGTDYLQPTLNNLNNFLNNQENINKINLIDKIQKTNLFVDFINLRSQLLKFNNDLLAQYQEFINTLSIAVIAQSDNLFYTQNKDNIDVLINSYVSTDSDIDPLITTGIEITTTIDNLILAINKQYERSLYIVINTLELPNYISLPNEAKKLRERLDDITTKEIDLNFVSGTIPTLAEILDYVKIKTSTITKTREKTKRAKKARRLKRKNKKKKNKKKAPDMIKKMEIDTSQSSNWISKVEFTFSKKEKINSDAVGTIKFYIKKGGIIKKVRVKRGTFSVIAVWSIGTKLGVGYRYWSQFNKAKIVNKNVFSYSLARINASDREIAIPIEIYEKRVKYS